MDVVRSDQKSLSITSDIRDNNVKNNNINSNNNM